MVFSEKIKLEREFKKWAEKNNAVNTPFNVITFLDSRGLLTTPPAAAVTDILEQVKESICDHYCKFPERYKPEEMDDLFNDYCDDCPLNKL